MKSLFLFLFAMQAAAYEPELRTDRYLMENPFTDHVQHFAKLFNCTKVRSFLEFGLGEGTKFFLDHCDEVFSIDIVPENNREVKKVNSDWFLQCLDIYQSYSNWRARLYFCTDACSQADEISNSMKDPALTHPFYLVELKILCDTWIDQRYDVIFVDAGTVLRADLVNELFDRADIIAAHDYWEVEEGQYGGVYGWGKIKAPAHYVKIFFKEGCGTVFWVHRDRQDVITALLTGDGR